MLLPTVLLRCRILVVPAKKQLDNMRKPCSRLFHLIYPSDRGNVCNLISYSLILIKDISDQSAARQNNVVINHHSSKLEVGTSNPLAL